MLLQQTYNFIYNQVVMLVQELFGIQLLEQLTPLYREVQHIIFQVDLLLTEPHLMVEYQV